MFKVDVIGNLGADAETRVSRGATFVAFRVAHTVKSVNMQTGEVVREAVWVSCSKAGDCANLIPYLRKGSKVYVRGNAQLKVYTGHDGKPHAGINLFVHELELCGSQVGDAPSVVSDDKAVAGTNTPADNADPNVVSTGSQTEDELPW